MSPRGPESASRLWSGGASGASGLDGPSSRSRPAERHATDLHELARGAVCAALYTDGRRRTLDDELRPILRRTCDAAREQDTLVERLLILLKDAWREQPVGWPKRHIDSEDTLARLITLCIEEYYAPIRRS